MCSSMHIQFLVICVLSLVRPEEAVALWRAVQTNCQFNCQFFCLSVLLVSVQVIWLEGINAVQARCLWNCKLYSSLISLYTTLYTILTEWPRPGLDYNNFFNEASGDCNYSRQNIFQNSRISHSWKKVSRSVKKKERERKKITL